ncbi:hypothetical protein AVT_02445 [Bacillus tropicus]|uniref:Uncharacterized protein n=1 Tax=Bacillus shihchuchen TaxID=3036942 RepID=A0ABT7KVA7_9BACI|nr:MULTISPECIES: hypothetical protein [Bacillus cereus group]EEL42565.1 hypothetical protein bcere0021_53760 [Bacillus cereus Rock3-42]MDL2418092.1 hypothetical protein [Bacillus shihchuchen]PDY90382.1 hypothetical protein CON09_17230 [Bacillus anthracis]PES26060.1 hypothetical protein CN488_01390 [Bacillus anthracis]PEY23084.1 hypothetical protein CN340_19670 [Bacillus anthracis]
MDKNGNVDSQNELQLIQKHEELQAIKNKFESQVMDTALELAEKESSLLKFRMEEINVAVKNDIGINIDELSEKAEEILNLDRNQSNEEIAIKLLEDISLNSKSKFLRSIAKSMLKEKWWEK